MLIYFARDIWRIAKAWVDGLRRQGASRRSTTGMGWYVIIGTIPICVLGLLFKDEIRTCVRNLWVIAIAMVVFSAVHRGRRVRRAADRRRRALTVA